MRKILIFSVVGISVVLLSYGLALALTGQCGNCHTMHNSQGGECQARIYSSGSLVTTCTPQGILLKGNCIGCHSSTGSSTIVNNTPIVWNTGGYPTQPLAGGNFYYVGASAGNKTKGHNVADLTSTTDIAPPGFLQATKPAGFVQGGSGWGPATWSAGTQVTCAGVYGCHGDRSTGYDDYDGIRGGHHSNKSTYADLDGTTVGKSYRFLAGIKGAEDSDWEQTNSSTDHNGYYGVTNYGDSNTISYLCGECHGNFHAHTNLGGTDEVGSGSPWLRHPTDIALTASSGSSFTTDYTTYNTETPVALATPSTSSSTVDTTSRVICLSCHAAHANQYDDIVRWDYSATQAGGGGTSGCLRCHQRQR